MSSPLPLSDISSPRRSSDVANTPSNSVAGSGVSDDGASPALRTPTQGERNPASSPAISMVHTPRSQRARSSPGSTRRSDLGSRSALGDFTDRSGLRSDGSDSSAQQGPAATIWGTTVDAQRTQRNFQKFFKEFREEGQEDGPPFYISYLEQLITADENQVNLDCSHIRSFNLELYEQLVNYPTEVIAIIDLVLTELLEKQFDLAEGTKLMCRTFNLTKEHRLRELDPVDIDKLVKVKGMVTRTSNVIPDLKVAFFECSVCRTPQEAYIDRGQIAEPQVCTNQACQEKQSMRILHNRCHFVDKQIIRLQESPEHMPEGETPQTVSMCTWQNMVDFAMPGDRVEITGIYRALPVRTNARRRTVNSLYKTYVDIVHVRKIERGRLRNESDSANGSNETSAGFEESNELREAGEERKQEILELSKAENLYEKLADALAPSVWEMEDIKKGILLQLFGAESKQLDKESAGGSAGKRGNINVLMVGDPGTSKSQLLQYVHKVAPRGMYTSGKGSSAVGLTAYVTRDPETKQFVLESGALVLSDRGVCCIDEFDKMSEGARSILHEAMEQQTVSVAKAGIICSLNARTAVLAAANPVDSKYDPKRTVVDNINLPPSLISRFDLIYLVLDKPNERTDKRLAEHLVSLYRLDRMTSLDSIPQRVLMEYISYARREVHPKISEEAANKLVSVYVKMRGMGSGRRVITATPRQLESLIRLSEAHARMRLSPVVEGLDVDEAERLMVVSLQSAAVDPKTGTIDMDQITTGRSASARTLTNHLARALRDKFLSQSGHTIQVSDLLQELQGESDVEISRGDLLEALDALMRDNLVRVVRNTVSIN
eukprot:CAMPEP_0119311654 /NCGR_PEP_ID=MMETSP1333-20130426/23232_1 /TAXON_ID=418940 /ORGANISM="Scyphosphaera apsteinii, Strain RCC1455" /LENGTH=831 /DNA_ID=CAMNT_0007316087 /DNA_START=39 /DNA_END=2534 /DNA_ORIENTATION=+